MVMRITLVGLPFVQSARLWFYCSCKPSIGLRCDLANTDHCQKKLREPSCLFLPKTEGRICHAPTNSLNPRSGLGRN